MDEECPRLLLDLVVVIVVDDDVAAALRVGGFEEGEGGISSAAVDDEELGFGLGGEDIFFVFGGLEEIFLLEKKRYLFRKVNLNEIFLT